MDPRNLILAIVLSIAILLGFQLLVGEPTVDQAQRDQPLPPGQTESISPPSARSPGAPAPKSANGESTPVVPAVNTRAEMVSHDPRVRIETPTLTGSISLVGGRLDDLILNHYREELGEDSDRIVLLSPADTAQPYYADFGWTSEAPGVRLPDSASLWQADGDVLTPNRPVKLSWDNGQGLRFQSTFKVDRNYLFTVTQRVVNVSDEAVHLFPYGLVSRTGTPEVLGFYILHEGLLGVFNDTLQEIDYTDVQDVGVIEIQSSAAWLGFTDKYWLVALVPDQKSTVNTRFLHDPTSGTDKYQADFLYPGLSVKPGAAAEVTSHIFAGAKEVALLDVYRDDFGFTRFDLSVDFGWFYFLTKPLFYALHYLAEMLGNFGLAILALTVVIKLLFFPLANKSYSSMAKMRKVQPEMLVLRERFGDDKQRLQKEMMELYKREGANPVSGCLPMLIQIPVFFALYKVMFVTIEMRHAPFYGWIQDLSAPDPTSILNAFGLLPWSVTGLGILDILNLGIWPIVMGLTMFLQQRLNPQPTDPVQAKLFLFMPFIFTFLLARFPAGLVIYWTWNNVLSIVQQYIIMRRLGVTLGTKKTAGTT